jgi:predicted RecA/RadA family phage recombinase
MTNKIRESNIIQYLAGADIVSGQPVVIGNRVGIAISNIANGSSGAVDMEGCFSVDKVSAQAWAAGDEIFWDASASKFTTVGTANTFAGHAMDIAANPTATGNLRLSPGYKKMALQADSAAVDVAAVNVQINALLAKLKLSGLMANA